MKNRKIRVIRKTKETDIRLELNLDGKGKYEIETTIPFLNHMLELFTKHSLFNLKIKAEGNISIDDHHLVEDIGIVLGEGLKKALKEKVGINRFGYCILPMDEALVLTAVDLSGRSYLNYNLDLNVKKIKNFEVNLIEEFFIAFTRSAGITLHIKKLSGRNTHHIIEATFKSVAVALKDAIKVTKIKSIPSTKGML